MTALPSAALSACGSLSAVCATAFSMPFDVARTRIVAQSNNQVSFDIFNIDSNQNQAPINTFKYFCLCVYRYVDMGHIMYYQSLFVYTLHLRTHDSLNASHLQTISNFCWYFLKISLFPYIFLHNQHTNLHVMYIPLFGDICWASRAMIPGRIYWSSFHDQVTIYWYMYAFIIFMNKFFHYVSTKAWVTFGNRWFIRRVSQACGGAFYRLLQRAPLILPFSFQSTPN